MLQLKKETKNSISIKIRWERNILENRKYLSVSSVLQNTLHQPVLLCVFCYQSKQQSHLVFHQKNSRGTLLQLKVKSFLVRERAKVINRKSQISLSLLYSSVGVICKLNHSKCNTTNKCKHRLLYLLCCNPWP